jgi:antibiotic biosynthesis monooxygenase (ABM) superfamily enzyme
MPSKVKLLISWDIRPSQEANTLEFMANELAPAIQQLGITPTEAWYTIYGDRPQILVGAVADDLATMRDILHSPEWQELMDKLDGFADNREQKLVRASGRLQL